MTSLIVTGHKINAWAVSWEKAYETHFSGKSVEILNLDPIRSIFKNSYLLEKEFSRNLNIKISFSGFFRTIWLIFKCRIQANSWLKAATSVHQWQLYRDEVFDEVSISRVLRSLLARTMGTSNFNLEECNRNLVLETLTQLFYSYHSTLKYLNSKDYFTEGFVCGGRDSTSAGIIAAFRRKRIPVRIIETTGIPTRWMTYQVSPHYAPEFWSYLSQFGKIQLTDEVSNWWKERLRGVDHYSQRDWGLTRDSGLISNSLKELEFVTFFTTSDFEIPIFPEFDYIESEFQDQYEALNNLINVAKEFDLFVVVRRHPNSLDLMGNDRESNKWREISRLPNVVYIPPSDRTDSIELLRRSKAVFTFKSSIGVEALWLNKPAYAMGSAKWAYTSEIRCWTMNKLRTIFEKDFHQENTQYHAILWAKLMCTMGCAYQFFEKTNARIAIFKGKKLSSESRLRFFLTHLIFLISDFFAKLVI